MRNFVLGLMIFLVGSLTAATYGNAGIFTGEGKTVRLEKTADIQMVSEQVDIYLLRAGGRVTGSLWFTDKARYQCKFVLKNLSNKKVTVPVGFPLSNGNFYTQHREEKVNQTRVISRFNFIAGTADGTYALRYVPSDVDKKYKHIFQWTMTFEPKQTVELFVSYDMSGYVGMGFTTWERIGVGDEKMPPLHHIHMETGIAQMFGYVTSTGNSWAGKIEKATFNIHLGEFEDYLRKRGAFEELPSDPHYEKRKEHPVFATLIRDIKPAGWKETEKKRSGKVITWEYKDFQPKEDINLLYVFSVIPQTVEQYDQLFESLRGNVRKNLPVVEKGLKQWETKTHEEKSKHENRIKSLKAHHEEMLYILSPDGEKEIADIILEFYGTKTNNPRIGDFLKRQIWYPVKNPPKLSAELKARLVKASAVAKEKTSESAK